ncbi:MAG: phosphopantetheine-binding protein [Gammaproteobacteria bacterium]|nr:phosphopantetheine-binding protein [Gammaproteobacteria bacterium]
MSTINQPFDVLMCDIVSLVIATLNMETTPEELDIDSPLFGDGLGLDSIDILEISLAISKQYGCQLRSDHEDNVKIFSSLRNLALYVEKARTK